MRVLGPTTPSAARPMLAWNWRVALSEAGPKLPSATRLGNFFFKRFCQLVTIEPLSPFFKEGAPGVGSGVVTTGAGAGFEAVAFGTDGTRLALEAVGRLVALKEGPLIPLCPVSRVRADRKIVASAILPTLCILSAMAESALRYSCTVAAVAVFGQK